jgi:hypothetical protein
MDTDGVDMIGQPCSRLMFWRGEGEVARLAIERYNNGFTKCTRTLYH